MFFNSSYPAVSNKPLKELQLLTQFSTIDVLLGDDYLRNLLISHSLIYSQQDEILSKYITTDTNVDDIRNNSLRAYYDSLEAIQTHLKTEKSDPELLIYDLKQLVDDSILGKNSDFHSDSPLLEYIKEHTNLFNLTNPSEFLRKKGSLLFHKVRKTGFLTGERAIQGSNYISILRAFNDK